MESDADWLLELYGIENLLDFIPIIVDHLPLPEDHDNLGWIKTHLNAALPIGCPDYSTQETPNTIMIVFSVAQQNWVNTTVQAMGIIPPVVLPDRMVQIAKHQTTYDIMYGEDVAIVRSNDDQHINTPRALREILRRCQTWMKVQQFLKRFDRGG